MIVSIKRIMAKQVAACRGWGGGGGLGGWVGVVPERKLGNSQFWVSTSNTDLDQ